MTCSTAPATGRGGRHSGRLLQLGGDHLHRRRSRSYSRERRLWVRGTSVVLRLAEENLSAVTPSRGLALGGSGATDGQTSGTLDRPGCDESQSPRGRSRAESIDNRTDASERRPDNDGTNATVKSDIAPATSERTMTLRLFVARSTATSADDKHGVAMGDHPAERTPGHARIHCRYSCRPVQPRQGRPEELGLRLSERRGWSRAVEPL
jgi:hypothetical protein